jgi:hypothetical protein
LNLTYSPTTIAQYTQPVEFTRLAARAAVPWLVTSSLVRFAAFWSWPFAGIGRADGTIAYGQGLFDAAIITLVVTEVFMVAETLYFKALKPSSLVTNLVIDGVPLVGMLAARGARW